MAKLGVNIDHVATIRQARGGAEPDPVAAAALAEMAGADGITVHLREDRRHIQDRDLKLLRQTVKTRLNLEMAATEEMVGIALTLKPDMCTLVPEKRQELTTEGGLDVRLNMSGLAEAVGRLQDGGIVVSLFIDPDPDQVKAASKIGADYIEIHTGTFAEARDWKSERAELERIENAIKLGTKLGLGINAGHGLNYSNIRKVAALGGIEEFNIGHSIISRAVFAGLDRAVRDMVDLVKYA
ncbi:pyridoxine 5'-phosphate synthase [Geobacter pickeringii]|uniref:Pyridoxine 5'-phosphate synthase n=1 Tax=Geobacter pickeringii TaxID=345632 RepID=A0A0B5B9B1_9BACT|nr:pyridoxine 5'-phosphate synthase [Geobacter pickeringii]AJE03152.1 pyridoxine 5'-phosphate synthase [Geobacter pickeringii]